MSKYAIKKFDGDDKQSYAIFYAKDVKDLGSIVFYGQAVPIVSGMSRYEAKHHRSILERKDEA